MTFNMGEREKSFDFADYHNSYLLQSLTPLPNTGVGFTYQ